MRVLMLSWEYPPHVIGGLGRHVTELARALPRTGAEVHVLTPRLRGGLAEERPVPGVVVQRIEPPRLTDSGYVPFVEAANAVIEQAARAAHAGERPFDLIHAHDWLMAKAATALKYAWRVPLIATIHATERGRGQGNLLNRGHSDQIDAIEWGLTYEAWRVIVCSRFMAGQVQAFFETPADKIDIVPNGVRLRRRPFASAAERQAFRAQFVPPGAPLVFSVSRLVYEKGVQVLIDAWPATRAAFPGARLLLAGVGEYMDPLKQRAWDLGLGHEIIFAGHISEHEKDKLFAAADLAVFPSLYEPFGIVALEAMAAGCPVIVADTGGLAEVVRQGETGLRVPPNDPGALAAGMIATLREPARAQAYARAALSDVRANYTWPRIAAATAAVYARARAEWSATGWGKELAQHETDRS